MGGFNSHLKLAVVFPVFSRFPLCLFYFIFSECIRLISLGHQWDLNSSALFTNHQTRKKITIPILPSSFLSRLIRWEEDFLPRSSLGLYIYVCNPSTSLSRCLECAVRRWSGVYIHDPYKLSTHHQDVNHEPCSMTHWDLRQLWGSWDFDYRILELPRFLYRQRVLLHKGMCYLYYNIT